MRAALLARAVRVLVGVGLTYDRPEVAAAIARISHEDATVLTASGLRHPTLFDRSANTAFVAHVTWLGAAPGGTIWPSSSAMVTVPPR